MREIKFRAWTGRVMINNVGVVPNVASDELMCCRDAYGKLETIHAEALMQYTGLKDENGVEVWEGDIVKFSDYYSQQNIEEVRYADSQAGFEPFTCMGEFPISGLVVIGNKYENPELLETI